MAEISRLDSSEAPRARRWDALILGSGIPALVAAARIGATGQRVLVVEEEARTMLPPAAREPFFLAGLRDEGILDACLRKLAVPLIDRRRLSHERLAYQIAADPYRIDIGQPIASAEELVTWGLAKPDDAQTLIRRVIESSEIERELLLDSPFVRLGRRMSASRPAQAIGNHRRGLPGDAASATGSLRQVLAAQIRGLSNVATQAPSPEAQARLLGLGLAGGVGFSGDPPWLLDLLRKRVTSLYGDFRTLSGNFEMVSVSGQPGIRVPRSGEIWLGRALILAAPRSALRESLGADAMHPAPDFLETTTNRRYRGVFLYRVPTAVLPEGMGARVILPGREADGGQLDTGTGLGADVSGVDGTITITAFPSQTHPGHVDLIARSMLPVTEGTPSLDLSAELASLRRSITERLEALMPFCGNRLLSIAFSPPAWDSDDGWLEDALPGMGWPAEIDIRLSSRMPIYHLDRAAAAGLGLEGDLLLGWRGGDAIAEQLA
ncbi:MAG: hypothetical protein ABGX04_18240 [Myxococcales bacterium]|nr:hypothetical protein [Myxococcales bacterium]HIK84996.1 hypothetical protein [Myxococcales bacterium]